MDDNQDQRSLRPFFTIWTGQVFSLVGSQLVQFAVVWWLTRTTGSATVLALATLAALLPQIILGPFAGALVDRWSRRWVMIAADTLSAVASLALAALFKFEMASVGAVYALLLVRSVAAAFHWPAMQASTTLMVPARHLARVAGLNQALYGAAGILIPPLGALAVELLPMQGILAIDVLTALPAVGCLLFTAIPQPPRSAAAGGSPATLLADMREGLRFILGWRGLMYMVLIGVLIHMLGQAAGSLLPLLVVQHYNGGAVQLGGIQSAMGVGTILGGVALGIWGSMRRKVVAQLLALVLDGLVIVGMGLSPRDGFWLAVPLFLAMGALEAVIAGLGGALFQLFVPPHLQGRLAALIASVSHGLAPLGLLVAGPVADAMGVPFWYVLTGCVVLVMGVGALCVPEIIHAEEQAHLYSPASLGARLG